MKTQPTLSSSPELPFLMHFQESPDEFVVEGKYDDEMQMLVANGNNNAPTTKQGPTNTPTRTGVHPDTDSDYNSTTDTYAD